jgi:hypothetical protein
MHFKKMSSSLSDCIRYEIREIREDQSGDQISGERNRAKRKKKPAQPRTRRRNVRDDELVRSHRLKNVISE